MNGVMGWALKQIGIEVMRMSAGVMRVQAGDAQLAITCACWFASISLTSSTSDLGGAWRSPLPLRASEREDRPYRLSLSEPGDAYWRFAEMCTATATLSVRLPRRSRRRSANSRGSAGSFKLIRLPRSSRILSSNAAQPYAPLLARPRYGGYSFDACRQEVAELRRRTRRNLRDSFDLDTPEAAALWPSICARHEALFAGTSEQVT